MNHYPLIRTIYLYIFALLGLVLIIIGGVRFIDMGLKAFVFTRAEEEQRISYSYPSYAPYSLPRLEESSEDERLTDEEIVLIKGWLADYKLWQEKANQIDPVSSRRHREASMSLAMILIGLPLYLYHWRIIKKETKENAS